MDFYFRYMALDVLVNNHNAWNSVVVFSVAQFYLTSYAVMVQGGFYGVMAPAPTLSFS